jgi:hypothetical protein
MEALAYCVNLQNTGNNTDQNNQNIEACLNLLSFLLRPGIEHKVVSLRKINATDH